MTDIDILTSIWQSNPNIATTDLFLPDSRKIPEIIANMIQFEEQEKKEKRTQIMAAIFLAALACLLLYNITPTSTHLIGIILLVTGVAFNIIANRTDNFPDIRQLKTLEYLQAFKANTLRRSTMHMTNAILGSVLLLPGCYLTFKDSFHEIGNWWMLIALLTAGYTLYKWFNKYHFRSARLLESLDFLIADFRDYEEPSRIESDD